MPCAAAGGVRVRGVAGQEEPSASEGVGEPVLEPHPRGPAQLADRDVERRRVQDVLHVCHRHLRTRLPERPAVVVRGTGGQEPPGRALAQGEQEHQPGPADPHVQHPRRQVPVQLEVGEHDLLGVPGTSPGDPRLRAYGARRAVAARQEPAGGLLDPVRAPQGRVRRVVVRGGVDDLDPPLDADPAVGERVGEHLLDVRLGEQGEVREGGVVQSDLAELRQDLSAADVQLGQRRPVGPVEQAVRHTQRAQALQGPRMHDHRPGRAERLRPALDDAHRRAVVVGLEGGGQPRGPGAHDQHVRPVGHAAATTRHHASVSAGA
nr:hypothetical protein [Nocardioides panacis]